MATAAQLTNVQDPYHVLTEQEQRRIILPTDRWNDQYALSIVRDSTEQMEQFIQQSGHYTRWTTADEQYVAWRQQRMWPGTRQQRARIPVFLLFSQLQSLLPNVMGALFPMHENVDVAPRPGSTMEQARAAWELIMAQLDSLGEEGILRFREIANDAFTQAYLYGNGIIEISWLFKIISKLVFTVDWQAPRQWVRDMNGNMIVAPVGQPKRILHESVQQMVLNQPHIQSIDIRDFLIDPQLRSPRIQEGRFCGVRSFPTVGELTQFRGQPGFKVPDDYVLMKLAEQKPQTMADMSKMNSASTWGRQWQVTNDYTNNPYDKRVEMVRWYSNDRCIWMLNRMWVFYNVANIYNFKPFLNAFYVPFPNRFHGISLSDVTEGDQHMISSLLEARIDELSLSLSAPFIRRQGTMLGNPGTLSMSPSKVIDVNDNPKDAIQRLETEGQTQTAMIETNDVYSRSARTTGLSDMAVMGVPQAGGDSSQRTAAGVDAKKAAAGTRILYLVENAQASLIEPLCTILHQFNIRFQPRDRMIEILGVDGQQKIIDPVQVLNAQPRFTVRAASRMRNRATLSQVLPWITQTIMVPEFLQLMAEQQHKKLNITNLLTLITDTLNLPRIDLFTDMTPEELQKMNQPDPKLVMDMQKQRERLQAMADMATSAEDKDLLLGMMKWVGTPQTAHHVLGLPDPQTISAAASLKKAQQKPKPTNGGGSKK